MAPDNQSPRHISSSNYKWVLCGLTAIAAFFLFTEHRAHLLGALPYLLLLSCPLMHLFMHHGSGGHKHHSGQQPSPPATKSTDVDPDRNPR
jgi:hypothetical protein